MKPIIIQLPGGPDVNSNLWSNAVSAGDDDEVWRLARQDAGGDPDTAALLRGEYWKVLFELLTPEGRKGRYAVLAPLYAESFVGEVARTSGAKIKHRYLGFEGIEVHIAVRASDARLILEAQMKENEGDKSVAANAIRRMVERGAFRQATWAAADRFKFEQRAKAIRGRLITPKSGIN